MFWDKIFTKQMVFNLCEASGSLFSFELAQIHEEHPTWCLCVAQGHFDVTRKNQESNHEPAVCGQTSISTCQHSTTRANMQGQHYSYQVMLVLKLQAVYMLVQHSIYVLAQLCSLVFNLICSAWQSNRQTGTAGCIQWFRLFRLQLEGEFLQARHRMSSNSLKLPAVFFIFQRDRCQNSVT